MKITLDFDGTLYSSARRIVDLAKIHYPETYVGGTFKDIKEFGFKPVLDIDQEKITKLFNRKDFYIPEYFIDGALDFIDYLQGNGHDVEILTVGTTYNNANKGLLLGLVGLEIKMVAVSSIGTNKVSFDKGFYSVIKKKNEISLYMDDRTECLNSVKGFDFIIQFREDGYVLNSDRNFLNYSTNYDIVKEFVVRLEKIENKRRDLDGNR